MLSVLGATPTAAPGGGEVISPGRRAGPPTATGAGRAEIGPWPDDDQLLRLIESAAAAAAGSREDEMRGMPRESGRFGRYRIVREIDRGRFSVVYLASDPGSGRRVALKVARPETMADAELRRRFDLEMELASRLDHPNIAPVVGVGRVGPLGYLATAYVEGGTLADWLRADAPPAPRQAAWLVREVAGAVGHAHGRGVLHLDLKPGNVLLGPGIAASPDDPGVVPLVIDFGLARLLDGAGAGPGGPALIGSPPYMAPEQVQRGASGCGTTADIYALGVILYELLVGRPPFLGASRLQTIRAVVEGVVVPPRRRRPSIPAGLEAICLKCLERSPAGRYRTAEELGDDLGKFLDGGRMPTPGAAP